MIYCGTDIIEVKRIKDAIEDNENFKFKIFTEKEIKDIEKSKELSKYQRYAGRFAAKEAIYKAISKILTNNNLTIDFSEIEVENIDDLKRRPKVNILNDIVCKCLDKCNIDVSISHVRENAIAMCVIEISES